jgi:hypothetical protein
MERIVVDQGRLSVPRAGRESASQISDLAEWVLPVDELALLSDLH